VQPPIESRTVPQPTAATTAATTAIPVFGARKKARELADETTRLRTELERLGAMDVVELERARNDARVHFERERAEYTKSLAELAEARANVEQQLADLRRGVVEMQDVSILQEVGVYEYSHPLANAEAYKARLGAITERIKAMARADGGAIEATTSWSVNGSAAEGRRMVSQTSKLMLRAYNAEADSLVRALKPFRVEASVDRLEKTAATIARLGTSMSIRVSPQYHRLRVDELELTADYLAKVAEEKEAERAAREALREQRRVEQEIAREREKLSKEREHYLNALAALREKGDEEGAARLEAQLADVDKAIADVDYRAANQRAGYVYVISNIGALGDRMIKVGMTRRLDPMERVRELGDASVPFGYDVHALFFADDAVGIEAEMHRRLADRRVNRINLRREFFYATPSEALEHLRELAGDVLTYTEVPEALEFRQSQNLRDAEAGKS
jgi:hypothetical protein